MNVAFSTVLVQVLSRLLPLSPKSFKLPPVRSLINRRSTTHSGSRRLARPTRLFVTFLLPPSRVLLSPVCTGSKVAYACYIVQSSCTLGGAHARQWPPLLYCFTHSRMLAAPRMARPCSIQAVFCWRAALGRGRSCMGLCELDARTAISGRRHLQVLRACAWALLQSRMLQSRMLRNMR